MSQASIAQVPAGLSLSGALNSQTGPTLREEGRRLLSALPARHVVVDCAAVSHANSVGLSLLLAFMRDAKVLGKTLTIQNLPQELRQIAQVSGVLALLPLAES